MFSPAPPDYEPKRLMKPLPFRIKIGITGHRENLPERTELKKKIREVLGIDEWNKSKTVAPNSMFSLFDKDSINQLRKVKNTSITFSILTALAEGADRIAAEAVLEMEGSKIEVVLPLTKEEYLEDFETEGSKKEFEDLLKLDYTPLYLRSHNLKGQYALSEIVNQKREAYFDAGKYIVDHCDVLIAIWDGIYTNLMGGTSEIIKYADKIGRPVIVISSINTNKVSVSLNNLLSVLTIK